MTDAPQLLTVARAAERLDVSLKTIRRLIATGELPVINIAPKDAMKRSLRVSVTDLKKFVAGRTRSVETARRMSPSRMQRLRALGLADLE